MCNAHMFESNEFKIQLEKDSSDDEQNLSSRLRPTTATVTTDNVNDDDNRQREAPKL